MVIARKLDDTSTRAVPCCDRQPIARLHIDNEENLYRAPRVWELRPFMVNRRPVMSTRKKVISCIKGFLYEHRFKMGVLMGIIFTIAIQKYICNHEVDTSQTSGNKTVEHKVKSKQCFVNCQAILTTCAKHVYNKVKCPGSDCVAEVYITASVSDCKLVLRDKDNGNKNQKDLSCCFVEEKKLPSQDWNLGVVQIQGQKILECLVYSDIRVQESLKNGMFCVCTYKNCFIEGKPFRIKLVSSAGGTPIPQLCAENIFMSKHLISNVLHTVEQCRQLKEMKNCDSSFLIPQVTPSSKLPQYNRMYSPLDTCKRWSTNITQTTKTMAECDYFAEIDTTQTSGKKTVEHKVKSKQCFVNCQAILITCAKHVYDKVKCPGSDCVAEVYITASARDCKLVLRDKDNGNKNQKQFSCCFVEEKKLPSQDWNLGVVQIQEQKILECLVYSDIRVQESLKNGMFCVCTYKNCSIEGKPFRINLVSSAGGTPIPQLCAENIFISKHLISNVLHTVEQCRQMKEMKNCDSNFLIPQVTPSSKLPQYNRMYSPLDTCKRWSTNITQTTKTMAECDYFAGSCSFIAENIKETIFVFEERGETNIFKKDPRMLELARSKMKYIHKEEIKVKRMGSKIQRKNDS